MAVYDLSVKFNSENSDEDRSDARHFLENYKRKGGKINWLDVGAGTGEKLLMILQGFSESYYKTKDGLIEYRIRGLLERFSDITLEIVEPNRASIRRLARKFYDVNLDCVLGNRYPADWETFFTDKTYDLITFFHSVYGIDRESLLRIPDHLTEQGVACFVVESCDSILHKAKREVSEYMSRPELMTTSEQLRGFFQTHGIDCSYLSGGYSAKAEQKFYIGKIIEGGDEGLDYLSFLFLTRPEDQRKTVPKKALERAREFLREHSIRDPQGRSYVRVPDGFVWMEK